MLSIFKKKAVRTTIEKMEELHQVVVYNLIDHVSVVAANLYKASTPLCNVTLIDIRDPLLPAETYIWLGVGTQEQLSSYYEKSVQPDQLTEIMENSIFFEQKDLMLKLSSAVIERAGGGIEKAPLLSKWNISASAFHENTKDIERIVRYYQVLDMCHEAHASGTDAADDIAGMSVESTASEIEAFSLKQKRLNKGLANKIRHITYPVKSGGVVPFIQFTTLDNVAFTILRRVMSTNKNFLHQSMGVYGQIIYSNKMFDKSIFETGTAPTLFIQGSN